MGVEQSGIGPEEFPTSNVWARHTKKMMTRTIITDENPGTTTSCPSSIDYLIIDRVWQGLMSEDRSIGLLYVEGLAYSIEWVATPSAMET
jgi:hypothetical protein